MGGVAKWQSGNSKSQQGYIFNNPDHNYTSLAYEQPNRNTRCVSTIRSGHASGPFRPLSRNHATDPQLQQAQKPNSIPRTPLPRHLDRLLERRISFLTTIFRSPLTPSITRMVENGRLRRHPSSLCRWRGRNRCDAKIM